MYRATETVDLLHGHSSLRIQRESGPPHGHNGRVRDRGDRPLRSTHSRWSPISRTSDGVVKDWIDLNLDHRMLLHKDDPLVAVLRTHDEPLFLMDGDPTAEAIARVICDYALSQGLRVRRCVSGRPRLRRLVHPFLGTVAGPALTGDPPAREFLRRQRPAPSVGIYSLVARGSWRFAGHWTGDEPVRSPLMLDPCSSLSPRNGGIFGVLFQGGDGAEGKPSRSAVDGRAVLPVFWLPVQDRYLQALLIAVVSTVHQASHRSALAGVLPESPLLGAFFDLTAQVLALTAAGVLLGARCVRHMAAGDPAGSRGCSAPDRPNRSAPAPFAGGDGDREHVHFAHWEGREKAPPGYAEGLVSLAAPT